MSECWFEVIGEFKAVICGLLNLYPLPGCVVYFEDSVYIEFCI